MRNIFTYLLFILALGTLSAEELHITNSEIEEYPNSRVDFYYYDDNFKLNSSFQKSDLELRLDGLVEDDFQLNAPQKLIATPLSVVISIDISENNKNNLSEITNTLNKLINYLDLEKIDFAIQAYNSNSYILENFTSDEDKIQRALGTLETFSFSNFNTAFVNSNSGSIDIARKSTKNSIVINISGGDYIGDSNSIANKANSFGVKLYNISIGNKIPKILQNISTRTGGKSYLAESEKSLFSSLIEIINKDSEIDPYSIEFELPDCDTSLNINITNKSNATSDEYIANYAKNKLPYIEIDPKFIDFGVVESGENEIEAFTLTARNSDIKLENILPTYAEITITPEYENIVLQKNSPKSFNLEYEAVNTNYDFKQLQIVSQSCITSVLDVFAGMKEGNVNNSELKLISPNGNELYYSGQNIVIQWDGVLASQEVILEFSTDNGANWNLITDKAIGKEYKWQIPDFQSDKMLIKVELSNGELNYKNIDYIRDANSEIRATNVDLSQSSLYAGISFDDGSLFVWDLDSNKIKYQLRFKNPDFQTTDITFGRSTNLFAASFGKNNEFNVVVWDIDNIGNVESRFFNKKVTKLDWAGNSTSLYIGFEDGEVSQWNLANNSVTTLFSQGSSIIDLAHNDNNNLLAIANENKILLIDENHNRLDSFNLTGIKDIDWSPNDDKLSVAYQSSDLRIYNLELNGNKFHFNFKSRINRSELNDIITSSWIDNNSVVIVSENSSLVEYWATNETKLFDFEIHDQNLKLLNSEGKKVISASDTNFALVWDIDDYPFELNVLDSDQSDDNWTVVKKSISVQNKDFGTLCINSFYNFEFEDVIQNRNEPTITIDSIVPLSNDIIVNNSFPIKLSKDEKLNLNLNYSPRNLGPFQHTIYIYYGGNREKLSITSNNKQADYSQIASNVEFSNTIINSKKTKPVEVLVNKVSTKIMIESVELIFGDEYFNIENIGSLELANNEKLILDLSFTPKNEDNISGLIKIKSKQFCNDVYLQLIGNGIRNSLSYSNQYNIGELNCQLQKDTTIVIKNFSQDPIEILNANLLNNSNGSYTIIEEDIPKSVSIGDSANIKVRFNSSEVGVFASTLEVSTNLSGPTNKIDINLETTRDTINLKLIENALNFGSLGVNESSIATVRVVNNSLLDFTFDNNFIRDEFRLVNANPNTISKGDTAELEFEFAGLPSDTSISFNMNFVEGCNSDFIIPLLVDISKGKPMIEVVNNLDFGKVICDTNVTLDVNVRNTGKSNLKFTNIYFEGTNSTLFQLAKDYSNFSIIPNSQEKISINYTPSGIGEINATLVLENNAENADNGITKILLKLVQSHKELQLLQEVVKFEGLRSNRKYSEEITIKNIGQEIIVPTIENDSRFTIDSVRPNFLLPDQTATVYITFIGGDEETNYFGQVKLIDECNTEYAIDMEAYVGGSDYISIKPDNIESQTGKLIDLNITFENTTGIAIPDNDTIKTKLIFNSTLLVPMDDKYKGKIDGEGMRVIDLEFPLKDKQLIYHIPVLVTLGDTSYSEIRLEQSTHLNNNFYIDDISKGSIRITNIVTTPNDRWIEGQGRQYMSETYPSPVVETAIIEYGIIENTNVKITLYDILGNKINTLVDRHHTAGEYFIEINPQNLSSGNYLYKLETPSMEIIKKMTIIK